MFMTNICFQYTVKLISVNIEAEMAVVLNGFCFLNGLTRSNN